VSFKVVPYLVKSKLEDHEHIHAEVCPGGWTYHYINTPETSALLQSHHDWTPGHPLNLLIKLELFTGDLKYSRRWEEPPIKLTPPYSETTAAEQLASHQYATMQLCNVQVHEEVFIGLLGGLECSEYVISALAFSDGHIEPGQDAVLASAATSGSYTGASFAAHDFSGSHNEDLVLTVDGQDQTVTLDENIVHDTDAVAALSAGLTGVVVVLDHGNIVVTSSSTGTASSVVLDVAHSGAHAAGLFGSGAAVAGTAEAEMGCGTTPASAGSYRSRNFHPYNFVGHEEDLVVVVDGGTPQIFTLSTNIVTPEDVVVALQSLTDASARAIQAKNVEFSFELHSGDAYYMTRHEDPPLLLAPPYRHAEFGHSDHGEAELCNVEHSVYFALYVSTALSRQFYSSFNCCRHPSDSH
jgi:hypothetical protein